jgi:cyclophilin family peptidyl-prolyl cis-trans isomerase
MKHYFLIMTLLATFAATSGYAQKLGEQKVLIETSMGNIVIKLYDDTPLHRDNFIKLVKSGFYDDLIFHRVIKDFMIQGGDPESKNAIQGKQLGQGDPGYQINAEIVYPKHFHKKGALAAARLGDQANPEKKSSGSQFYIVQGKIYTNEELDQMEQSISLRQTQTITAKYMEPHREAYMKLRQSGDSEGLKKLNDQIMKEASDDLALLEAYKLPQEVRKAYTTIGGTPHLDDAYTVFGEVVEGFDVIDKIAKVQTNNQDRPLENIIMKIKIVNK